MTNPIWVAKTQLQLLQPSNRSSSSISSSSTSRRAPLSTLSTTKPPTPSTNFFHSFRRLSSPPAQLAPRHPTSYSIILSIYQRDGLRGFYKGLSASLLGVTEGVIQWGLYEQFKLIAKSGRPEGEEAGWRVSVAAGSAKLIATMITYPHEVRLIFPFVSWRL